MELDDWAIAFWPFAAIALAAVCRYFEVVTPWVRISRHVWRVFADVLTLAAGVALALTWAA